MKLSENLPFPLFLYFAAPFFPGRGLLSLYHWDFERMGGEGLSQLHLCDYCDLCNRCTELTDVFWVLAKV